MVTPPAQEGPVPVSYFAHFETIKKENSHSGSKNKEVTKRASIRKMPVQAGFKSKKKKGEASSSVSVSNGALLETNKFSQCGLSYSFAGAQPLRLRHGNALYPTIGLFASRALLFASQSRHSLTLLSVPCLKKPEEHPHCVVPHY